MEVTKYCKPSPISLSMLKVDNENWSQIKGREICAIRKNLRKNLKILKMIKNEKKI